MVQSAHLAVGQEIHNETSGCSVNQASTVIPRPGRPLLLTSLTSITSKDRQVEW
ncbi:hypothetical protein DPMN_022352 [Dreissena polymorpha]|uniref:Uncharacterized protein n=1 Tax=Dreissena polymorpha TaxID=45954 RepID=A0A9D3YYX9_DREPO|nr:hypothetical protein DPMN_066417 [Dreissena polymorpha]KAH3898133.1 hypothetical protein DPMN_022352 [Dreissena polymorpha]